MCIWSANVCHPTKKKQQTATHPPIHDKSLFFVCHFVCFSACSHQLSLLWFIRLQIYVHLVGFRCLFIALSAAISPAKVKLQRPLRALWPKKITLSCDSFQKQRFHQQQQKFNNKKKTNNIFFFIEIKIFKERRRSEYKTCHGILLPNSKFPLLWFFTKTWSESIRITTPGQSVNPFHLLRRFRSLESIAPSQFYCDQLRLPCILAESLFLFVWPLNSFFLFFQKNIFSLTNTARSTRWNQIKWNNNNNFSFCRLGHCFWLALNHVTCNLIYDLIYLQPFGLPPPYPSLKIAFD